MQHIRDAWASSDTGVRIAIVVGVAAVLVAAIVAGVELDWLWGLL